MSQTIVQKDIDTTLTYNVGLGFLILDGSAESEQTFDFTPKQAVDLASGLLQFATQARTEELSLAREKADKESAA